MRLTSKLSLILLSIFYSWAPFVFELIISPPGHSRTVSLFSLSVTASNYRSNVYTILPVSANEAKTSSLVERGNVFTLPIKSYNVKKQDVSVVIEGHFTPFWCIGIATSRIKDVWSHLSQAVSEKRASELLHSMVASQDILFWTPHGQLLWNKRTIPVTNIADLVEYVLLLPHNNDVTKPRARNTFPDEIAELGFDKVLIKNKKLLSDF